MATTTVLGTGAAVVWLVTHFVVQFFEVLSASMAPTIQVGDRIVVQKRSGPWRPNR